MIHQHPRDAGLVGEVLGGAYRLNRLIGRGGMGAVFEATHLRLERRVAVKVMAHHLLLNQEALARFHREVRITSRLAHPHVVQVSDFGTTPAGEPYLVMEYLDGEDLEQRLRRVQRLSLSATIHVVSQVAAALGATHGKGVVHRDLKPANVFLLALEGENDFVKVVDFGISKVKNTAARLTRASMLLGTPDYMAPEQAAGLVDDIDHRTDQWALACMAWEMLSGRRPFMADNLPMLLYQIAQQHPPPLQVPDLPAEVELVLRRALSKRQSERFPTVAAFARALGAATTPRPIALESAAGPSKRETLTGSVTQSLETLVSAPVGWLARLQKSVGRMRARSRRRKALTRPLQTIAVMMTAFGGQRTRWGLRRKRGGWPLRRISAVAGVATLLAGAALVPWSRVLPGRTTDTPAPTTIAPRAKITPLPAPAGAAPLPPGGEVRVRRSRHQAPRFSPAARARP
jgi:serine/threonine protein kinase